MDLVGGAYGSCRGAYGSGRGPMDLVEGLWIW